MESGRPPEGQPSPQQPPPAQHPGYAPPAPEAPPGGYPPQVPPGGWYQPPGPARQAWAGVPLAGWGSRAGAALLDGLVLLGLAIVLIAPGVIIWISGADAIGIALFVLGILAYIVVAIGYAPYFMQRAGAQNGQTLGKQWVGIRALRDNGQPFDLGSALLREFVIKNLLFATVGSFFVYIPTLLDYLWPLWDDQNRALHDMVATTHVVRA